MSTCAFGNHIVGDDIDCFLGLPLVSLDYLFLKKKRSLLLDSKLRSIAFPFSHEASLIVCRIAKGVFGGNFSVVTGL